jgi:hypothetical protein
VAVALPDLPRYLVIDPVSTVRLEIHLQAPSCEIDVSLDNPRPGRSFVLLIGHPNGPFVQRVRLAGKARIHFAPESPGDYLLLLANPHTEPLVLRLKARDLETELLHPSLVPPKTNRGEGRRRTRDARRRPSKAPTARSRSAG